MKKVEEHRDHTRVDQVGEHAADDWHDEEGLHRVVIFVAHSTHVGHRVGRGSQAEAADARTQHSSIVVAPQQGKGHHVSKQHHKHDLRHEDSNERVNPLQRYGKKLIISHRNNRK